MSNTGMARALGLAGMGLGVAELVAPRWVSRQLGVRNRGPLLRAFGAREVLSGIGILTRRSPRAGLWARVAGDAMDAAALAMAAKFSRKRRGVAAALAMVLAIGGLDLLYARRARPVAAAA